MAKKVIWSELAYMDKVQIFKYWKNRNKSNLYSRKLNKLFKDIILLVIEVPALGKKTNIKNVKRVIARDYFIFYEERTTEIIILRIWDSRQDLNAFFLK